MSELRKRPTGEVGSPGVPPGFSPTGDLGAELPQERQSARIPATEPASSGETVCIACKLPNGLILRNFHMEKRLRPMIGDVVAEVVEAIPDPETITLNGFSIDYEMLKKQRSLEKTLAGGFALTYGVPKDFWLRWLSANSDSAIVRNGLVFAADTEDRARGMARERAGVQSNLEPIDPDHPNDRMPKTPGIRMKIEAHTGSR